jgi:phospholipase/carboxylesterase
VLLHGVGSNEQDLFSLAPFLDPRLLIISARAPHVVGPGAFAWYHIEFTPKDFINDPAESEASRKIMCNFVAEAIEAYGADPQRVILGGFSQGAIMTLSVAITQPKLLRGACVFSGRLLPEMKAIAAPASEMSGLPILVSHGTLDQVLPIWLGRETRDYLSTLPVELSYHEYPVPHTIGEQGLADAAKWLTAVIDGQPRSLTSQEP